MHAFHWLIESSTVCSVPCVCDGALDIENKRRERAGESVSPVHGAVRKVLKIFDSERCICAKVFTLSFSVYLFACQWNHLRVRCVFLSNPFSTNAT